MDLFNETRHLPLDGAQVVYHPAPDLGMSADELFNLLRRDIVWEQHSIKIEDRVIPQPRLSSWYGDVVHTYSTLAHVLTPHAFTPLLEMVRERVETICASKFNSMLANLYRSGDDAIGWHSDNEPELGPEPLIASISLGAERRFDLRRRDDHSKTVRLVLEHGSLLVMSGETQRNWQHGVARTKQVTRERINLTFRLTAARRHWFAFAKSSR
ncbi:alpha-ketoglutarate-dependent dioxygenase AlkB family protein [Agrobacterium rosae]|uniref:Alpha-ketoglutarate-dependent dioxygenase AlkB n=1 Tax=Agrobacterium rosae TaxID=1972867 RepID=A0AAW9FHU8_9HYPH|nr:alpha-ketoglutarate-dependent dioxygenase AlkB [Agrobacterium rosae]MDX8305040.1 alpha-ketoglutarate-dependent dioxygenase AlkB [Agrobacterium rosae]